MGEARKYTEAQKQSARKWDAANLDRISIALPKGNRDTIKAHAAARGESVNGFIGRAIDKTMERDNAAADAGAKGNASYVLPDGSIMLQDGALHAAEVWGAKCGESPVEYVSNALLARLERDKKAEKKKEAV